MVSPRERMVVSAALLIRERGAHRTAIADVLEHSGAPRGSAYHYFPGGRNQLLCEAIDYAGEYLAQRIEKADSGVEVLDGLVGRYRARLIDSGFRAGCPLVAVTIEAEEADEASAGGSSVVIDRAAAAFARWNELIAQLLVADGVAPARAGELATLITASIEGAIVLARAARDVAPLDQVHRSLRALIEAETPKKGDDRDC